MIRDDEVKIRRPRKQIEDERDIIRGLHSEERN